MLSRTTAQQGRLLTVRRQCLADLHTDSNVLPPISPLVMCRRAPVLSSGALMPHKAPRMKLVRPESGSSFLSMNMDTPPSLVSVVTVARKLHQSRLQRQSSARKGGVGGKGLCLPLSPLTALPSSVFPTVSSSLSSPLSFSSSSSSPSVLDMYSSGLTQGVAAAAGWVPTPPLSRLSPTSLSSNVHTQKRFYAASSSGTTSASASAASSSRSGAEGHDSTHPHQQQPRQRGEQQEQEEGEEEVQACASFEDILGACKMLGLVQPGTTCVKADWDETTLKKAYRELVKRYHPDVDGGDADVMEGVNAANDLLESLRAPEREAFALWIAEGGEQRLTEAAMKQDGAVMGEYVSEYMAVGFLTSMATAGAAMWWGLYHRSSQSALGSEEERVAKPQTRRLGLLKSPRSSSSACGGLFVNSQEEVGAVGLRSAYETSAFILFQYLRERWEIMLRTIGASGSAARVMEVVSRYGLAVAVALAACANTCMVRLLVLRLLPLI